MKKSRKMTSTDGVPSATRTKRTRPEVTYRFGNLDGRTRYEYTPSLGLLDLCASGADPKIPLDDQAEKLLRFLLERRVAVLDSPQPPAKIAAELGVKPGSKNSRTSKDGSRKRKSTPQRLVTTAIHRLNKAFADSSGEAGFSVVANTYGEGWYFSLPVSVVEESPRLRSEVDSGTVPYPLPDLIGRTDEIAELVDLLGKHVNISGGPGRGKTELALEVAMQVRERRPNLCRDGMVFIDCGGFASKHLPNRKALSEDDVLRELIAAVDRTVDSSEVKGPELASLAQKVVKDRYMLVIADDVATFNQVRALAHLKRPLCLLVTSRSVLAASVLHSYPLEPLKMDKAIKLLTKLSGRDRGLASRGIAEQCEQNPLALSIAARALRRFGGTSEQFLAQLQRSVEKTLASGTDDESERLSAVIESSYETMDDLSKRRWTQLSVFPGAWTVGAANAILLEPADSNFLDKLADDYGLLKREYFNVARKNYRFRMHDCSREFAYSKFAESSEFVDVTRRFGRHYLRILAENAAQVNSERSEATVLYAGDMRNFDAAKEVFESPDATADDAETFVKTFVDWHRIIHSSPSPSRGRWAHIAVRLGKKLDSSTPNLLLYGRALDLDGMVLSFEGRSTGAHRRYMKSRRVLQQALRQRDVDVSQRDEANDLLRRIERQIGWRLMDTNQHARAITWFEGAIARVQESEHPNKQQQIIDLLDALGDALSDRGKLQEARRCFIRILLMLRKPGLPLIPEPKEACWNHISVLVGLGILMAKRSPRTSLGAVGTRLTKRALKIAVARGSNHARGILAQRIGDTYALRGMPHEADAWFLKSIDFLKQHPVQTTLAESLLRRIEVAEAVENPNLAELLESFRSLVEELDPANRSRFRLPAKYDTF